MIENKLYSQLLYALETSEMAFNILYKENKMICTMQVLFNTKNIIYEIGFNY